MKKVPLVIFLSDVQDLIFSVLAFSVELGVSRGL